MSVLNDAQQAVAVDRQLEHGDPVPNLERTAQMWSAILGVQVDAQQVALCMISHKVIRASVKGSMHRDNLIDICGYARIIEMMWDRWDKVLSSRPGGATQVEAKENFTPEEKELLRKYGYAPDEVLSYVLGPDGAPCNVRTVRL